MSGTSHKPLPTIGFLSVVEGGEQTLIGGYLVLNTIGRPLEFHCTAPVKTSRAQEILYGPTLKPFLYGEQIGQTLLEKSHFHPLFICTDLPPVLALRDAIHTPVALVAQGGESDEPFPLETEQQVSDVQRMGMEQEPTGYRRIDREHGLAGQAGRCSFALGSYSVTVASRFTGDCQRIIDAWEPYANEIDLLEPFERIREAIAEAQRVR